MVLKRIDKQMTIGISKKRLREWKRLAAQRLIDWEILDILIKECKELNPWLPIDENTPKNRTVWLSNGKNMCLAIWSLDRWREIVWMNTDNTDCNFTHWQELPEDPKND